jgi:hypothetical protein
MYICTVKCVNELNSNYGGDGDGDGRERSSKYER